MQIEQSLEVDTTQARDSGQGRLIYPPRFGMKWGLPAAIDSAQYFGKPSQPDNTDSCHNNYVGLYRRTMEDSVTKKEIRWWMLSDKQGHGWLISADSSVLNMRVFQRRLNIDHPPMERGADNYHYHYI